MKQWKFDFLVAVPLLCFGFIGFAIAVSLGGIHTDYLLNLMISGTLLFLLCLGFFGIISGLYYYAYERNEEFGA